MPGAIRLLTTNANVDANALRGWTSAGYSRHDVLDNNPDKYWQSPASAAADNLDIDLATVKRVDAIVLFINNYKTDHDYAGGGWRMSVYADSDDSGYESTQLTNLSIDNTLTNPIFIADLTSLTTDRDYRYWRVRLDPASAGSPIIQIGCLWLGRERDLAQGNQWPENDAVSYLNKSQIGGGGYRFVLRQCSHGREIMPRSFLINNSTNYDALRNAYDDSYGDGLPLVLEPDATMADAKAGYIINKSFAKVEGSSNIYRPSFTFQEIAYIPDGDNF
jgi:hypothetical protein